MKTLSKIFALAAALSFVGTARALNFDLNTSAATIFSGNTTSSFYEVTGSGTESGSASGLYGATVGGNENSGFWVKIAFGSNPQPVLTSAFLKASNQYLWWDSADLAGFNAGTYDSITLWNSGPSGSGIGHFTGNGAWKFHGTSHAGINGTPGTNRVPDAGSSVTLLGLALTGLGIFARRFTR